MVDDGGQWLGTVAEWIDRTQEVAVEEEIANIVVAASAGDLSMRIRKDGKDGFFATLADGMNGILTNMSTVVAEVNAVVEAGKNQDLTARIDVAGKSGVFEQLSKRHQCAHGIDDGRRAADPDRGAVRWPRVPTKSRAAMRI